MAVDLLEPLGDVEGFQDRLLLGHIDAKMPGHQVGQTRGFAGVGDGGKRLFGDVLLDLGIPLELFADRADHGFDRGLVTVGLRQGFSGGFEVRRVVDKAGDLHPRLAFDKHLDGTIGKLEQLQHVGQHAHAEDAIGVRVVGRRVLLRGQQDLLVVLHHLFQRTDRLFASDEQGHDHVGKDHDVAQRQHGIAGRLGHLMSFVRGNKGLAPTIGNRARSAFWIR